MNIPEWQTKMIRTSAKSIMKQANKHQQEVGGYAIGGNGTFKDDAKHHNLICSHMLGDDKKVPKGKIDPITGKRKYTKKFLKTEGILSNSESNLLFQEATFLFPLILKYLEIKERKKHKKRRGSNLTNLTAQSQGTRKYTFKKRVRKIQFSDPISSHLAHNSYTSVHNGMNGGNDKLFEPIIRSKNSSPIPNQRPEK